MKLKYIVQMIAMIGASSLTVGVLAQQAPVIAPEVQPETASDTTQQELPTLLTATQAAQSGLTLSQVVEQALITHPEVGARYQDFMSAVEGQNVARGGWKPQITAQGWVGREWRGSAPNAPAYDWNRTGWSLDLRQLIFDGFATSNGIRQLGLEKLSKFYDLRATSEALASEVVAAYLDVQRYREMQRLAHDNFTMHKSTLDQLRERQQSGVGRGVDLEQASGRVSLAQTNLMTESNNLNDVTQRYRRLVGQYPAPVLDPVPDVTPKLPISGVTQDFGDALRINPSILSKQALVQAAQAGEKVAKAAHSPVLELRATTGKDRDQPPSDTYRDVQASRVQLLLTYNLYRGGADQARLRQTIVQGYAARDVRDYTCRNVQQELSIAWNNIVRLRQQIPFMQEHELSTSKVRTAYQQQFQIGQRSLLDLLDTENELFDARRALTNAQYDLKKAEYQWLTMASQVLPALGLAQPHADSQPEEQQALELPDDMLHACMTDMPDTSNLEPAAIAQPGQAEQPPLLQTNPPVVPLHPSWN